MSISISKRTILSTIVVLGSLSLLSPTSASVGNQSIDAFNNFFVYPLAPLQAAVQKEFNNKSWFMVSVDKHAPKIGDTVNLKVMVRNNNTTPVSDAKLRMWFTTQHAGRRAATGQTCDQLNFKEATLMKEVSVPSIGAKTIGKLETFFEVRSSLFINDSKMPVYSSNHVIFELYSPSLGLIGCENTQAAMMFPGLDKSVVSPDIAITTVNVVPDQPKMGEDFTVNVTVKNNSTIPFDAETGVAGVSEVCVVRRELSAGITSMDTQREVDLCTRISDLDPSEEKTYAIKMNSKYSYAPEPFSISDSVNFGISPGRNRFAAFFLARPTVNFVPDGNPQNNEKIFTLSMESSSGVTTGSGTSRSSVLQRSLERRLALLDRQIARIKVRAQSGVVSAQKRVARLEKLRASVVTRLEKTTSGSSGSSTNSSAGLIPSKRVEQEVAPADTKGSISVKVTDFQKSSAPEENMRKQLDVTTNNPQYLATISIKNDNRYPIYFNALSARIDFHSDPDITKNPALSSKSKLSDANMYWYKTTSESRRVDTASLVGKSLLSISKEATMPYANWIYTGTGLRVEDMSNGILTIAPNDTIYLDVHIDNVKKQYDAGADHMAFMWLTGDATSWSLTSKNLSSFDDVRGERSSNINYLNRNRNNATFVPSASYDLPATLSRSSSGTSRSTTPSQPAPPSTPSKSTPTPSTSVQDGVDKTGSISVGLAERQKNAISSKTDLRKLSATSNEQQYVATVWVQNNNTYPIYFNSISARVMFDESATSQSNQAISSRGHDFGDANMYWYKTGEGSSKIDTSSLVAKTKMNISRDIERPYSAWDYVGYGLRAEDVSSDNLMIAAGEKMYFDVHVDNMKNQFDAGADIIQFIWFGNQYTTWSTTNKGLVAKQDVFPTIRSQERSGSLPVAIYQLQ